MEFISKELDNYVCNHTTEESELLNELNRQTNLRIQKPRMISGHFQGRVLSMFSKMIAPKRILEVGTYTGYSALCLAEGLADDGKLVTIDNNPEQTAILKEFVEKSAYKNQIEIVLGDASHEIQKLNETWDLIFIDADKFNYLNYYNLLIPKLRSGGILIADNVLWSGKVLENVTENDKHTKELLLFNTFVQNDNRVENVLFPIRDGLMVVMKK